MYTELGRYFRATAKRKELWKDGDFITAVVVALACAIWFACQPEIMDGIRKQFSTLLSAASIIFGFALATLTFYISAVSGLRKDQAVRNIADKLVDWHVWTVLSLLLLIGWLLALWMAETMLSKDGCVRIGGFAVLVFLAVYSGGQVVNHTLTLWWFHHRRSELQNSGKPDEPNDQTE